MAELAKKLHFLKNGTEQTAKAYSTTGEAGDNYVPVKIDGVACYAPLGATDEAMATNGRVIKGGTTYAIKSQAKPPYTEVKYTTAGTHTFTVPAGVTRMRVAVCGGGGGGLAINYNPSPPVTYSSKAGGTSYFGSPSTIQATGGGGCSARIITVSDSDGDWSKFEYKTAGTAGSPNGTAGTISGNTYAYKGTYNASAVKGFALSFTKTSGTYGTSGGGNVHCTSNNMLAAGSGGSGGYKTDYVNVTPNQTYPVVVGSAGEGLVKLTNGSASAFQAGVTNASSGFVLIAYGGDI